MKAFMGRFTWSLPVFPDGEESPPVRESEGLTGPDCMPLISGDIMA
jgi:hypothetical protein